MKERFIGDAGRRLLIDTLARQLVCQGSRDQATALADKATVDEFQKGHVFISQGGEDNDMYFIVAGQVGIDVNDRQIAERKADQHVGEMALIDSSARRSASVRCLETTVVAKVSEGDFNQLAEKNPHMWRMLALELSRRLLERNKHVPLKNKYPQVFIGSSAKAMAIAQLIKDKIESAKTKVFLWFDGVFTASTTTIETLEQKAKENDFAILVLNADDISEIKEKVEVVPRDNVIFELGLFMGSLGRNRSFMVVPKEQEKSLASALLGEIPKDQPVKLPTDLIGVTVLFFEIDPQTHQPLLDKVCEDIQRIMDELGPK